MANTIFSLDDRAFFEILKGFTEKVISKSEFISFIVKIEGVIDGINKEQLGVVYFPASFLSERINGKSINEILLSANDENRDVLLKTRLLINKTVQFCSEDEMIDEIYDYDGSTVSSSFIQGRVCGFISNRNPASEYWWNEGNHSLVTRVEDIRPSYRKSIYCSYGSYSEIKSYSDKLWPNCFFTNHSSRFSQLSIHEMSNLSTVLSHLDYLNDYAQLHFSFGRDLFISKANEFNVELSPESPKTRVSDKLMRKRNVKINDKEVCCEWHTKITKTAGRIHFHEGRNTHNEVKSITSEKVIIGRYEKHLST